MIEVQADWFKDAIIYEVHVRAFHDSVGDGHGDFRGLTQKLDYLEDLAKDDRPYLDGRAIGLIATAYGDQATMSTLQTLRSIIHALRGWPTPMGATVRVYQGLFSPDGECLEDRARLQLEMVGRQTVRGARALSRLGQD